MNRRELLSSAIVGILPDEADKCSFPDCRHSVIKDGDDIIFHIIEGKPRAIHFEHGYYNMVKRFKEQRKR